MAGTRRGGLKAGETNKKLYGEGFYPTIGALGGKKSRGGGFAKNPELAREAGRKGGFVSKRRSKIEDRELRRELDLYTLSYEEIV